MAYAEAALKPALAPFFPDPAAQGITIDGSGVAALEPSAEDIAAGGLVRIAGHVVVVDFLPGTIGPEVDAAAPEEFRFIGSAADLAPLRPVCAGVPA
ncbi:MAG: hypothetical protein HC783_09000 [Rhodobacteraceae bacterium]|nr:hypothetical protein [Paracoccaceae bacterium]